MVGIKHESMRKGQTSHKKEHNTRMCFPLKPVFTRDKGGLPNFMDEATSGLDPIVRDEILSIIREYTEDEDHTVLMSSHITSDLDKISDYIAYIHEGKLLFMKPYDELREEYGIIHAGKELLDSLNKDDIVGYVKEAYNYTILVKNRSLIQSVFKDLEMTRPTVEEIMLFHVKGGCERW